MNDKDELGNRMKKFYEEIPKTKLIRRMPVVIRIDGKAFHTFTKGFNKPFDKVLMKTMQETTKYLCENIQNCVFGYTQSDEITLVLVDYKKFETSAWFDNEVQKICSVSASMATMKFNQLFYLNVINEYGQNIPLPYIKSIDAGALFDSRCFNIPREEVCNMIFWRQLDASRNSVESVGHHYFTQSELHKKNVNQIQDMLLTQKNINWNDYSIPEKRGTSVLKDSNGKWYIDYNMPILKGDDRGYVNRLIYIE